MGAAVLLSLLLVLGGSQSSAECDVARVLSATQAPYGTHILTTAGSLEEAELVLVPSRIEPGRYVVTVTRKASNLYRIDGRSIYLITRYCYEYAYGEGAILDLDSYGGYTLGTIEFK